MILALIGLVRATNPAMLRQGPDGFTVDFESLAGKPNLTGDESLLLKLRVAMEAPAGPPGSPLILEAAGLGREAPCRDARPVGNPAAVARGCSRTEPQPPRAPLQLRLVQCRLEADPGP